MTTGYKVTEFFKKHHPKKAHKQRFDPTTIIKQETFGW